MAAGAVNGCVGIWDVRKGFGPVESTPIDVGHTESVTSLIWSNSKTGSEFFSTAADGQVMLYSFSYTTPDFQDFFLDSACPSRAHFVLNLIVLLK